MANSQAVDWYGKNIILKIIENKPKKGKTFVMKMVFILQQIYKVDMGYDFNIYTYGPYSSEVTEDVEYLIHYNALDVYEKDYGGFVGYELEIANEKSKEITISPEDEEKLKKALDIFGDKKVKDLEIQSTIIYLNQQYVNNGWNRIKEDIMADVKEVKPRFSDKHIEQAYDELMALGMLF